MPKRLPKLSGMIDVGVEMEGRRRGVPVGQSRSSAKVMLGRRRTHQVLDLVRLSLDQRHAGRNVAERVAKSPMSGDSIDRGSNPILRKCAPSTSMRLAVRRPTARTGALRLVVRCRTESGNTVAGCGSRARCRENFAGTA